MEKFFIIWGERLIADVSNFEQSCLLINAKLTFHNCDWKQRLLLMIFPYFLFLGTLEQTYLVKFAMECFNILRIWKFCKISFNHSWCADHHHHSGHIWFVWVSFSYFYLIFIYLFWKSRSLRSNKIQAIEVDAFRGLGNLTFLWVWYKF